MAASRIRLVREGLNHNHAASRKLLLLTSYGVFVLFDHGPSAQAVRHGCNTGRRRRADRDLLAPPYNYQLGLHITHYII